MSTQAAAVEQAVLGAPEGRRRTFAGAWLLSGAMVVSGALTYAFHVLAARTLGADAYGQIAVLWGAMFLAAVVLFRPIEQTTSRAIADRLTRGDEVRTVLRSAGAICSAVLVLALAGAAAAWGPITDRLFLGSDALTAMLLGGIAVYGAVYLVRGLVGGLRWFKGYSLGLLADAVARLAIAAPLAFVASKSVAATAVVAAGVAGFAVPLLAGRRLLRSAGRGERGGRFRPGAALAFAAPASVIAAADQLLVNGAPLLVVLEGGSGSSHTAGVVFAATMLVRVPVYVFQGLAASLLPNLTCLHALDDGARLRRAVVRVAGFLLAAGAVIVVLAAVIGPEAMRFLYGPEFEAGRRDLTLLGAGVGCYLAAGTLSQALLALDRGVGAAFAWGVSAALFVAVFALAPGAELARISLAFTVAALADLVLLAIVLRRPSRR